MRTLRPFLVLVVTALVVAAPARAQAGAERLAFAPCADAARPHLEAAVLELENIGGIRADAHLEAALAAAPDCPLVRAFHAYGHSALAPAERMRELDAAVGEAAAGPVAELIAIAALREWRRGNTPARAPLLDAAVQLTDDPFFAVMRTFGPPDNDERAELLEAVIARFPDNAAAYNALGYALYRSGRHAEGLEAIERYVRLLPDHPNPHDSHAEMLQLGGRLDEAERAYRRAVEVDPGFDEAYAGLAEVAQLRGDHAAARRQLESALERAPNPMRRVVHLRALAFNAAIAGDFQDVRRYMRASADEAEKAGNAVSARTSRSYLAYLEAAEGHADHARKEWAARRADDDPYLGLGEAYIHAALGDVAATAHALAELERSAAANPSVNRDAVPLARLMAAAARGDVATARARLEEIRGPGWRVIGHAYLARAYRRAGDREAERLALAEVDGYRQVDIAAAYARRLVRGSAP